MNDFLEKWKTDKKFKTKIKLLLYTLFVVIISIYAISVNDAEGTQQLDDDQNNINQHEEENDNQNTKKNIIEIPEKYNYEINIYIDDEQYQYSGTKKSEQTTIHKEVNNIVTNYIYQDNNYYVIDTETSIITTKDEVYDVVNYSYINLGSINKYLENSEKQGNQYIVYLKDIILGSDSEEYISILINDNKIEINYTKLMKSFNNDIEQYIVNIELEEIE